MEDCPCRKQRPSDDTPHVCGPVWIDLGETVPGEVVTLSIPPGKRGHGADGATVTVETVGPYMVRVRMPDGWIASFRPDTECSID